MKSKIRRELFTIIWFFLAKWNPKGIMFRWRNLLLRLFGAKIEGSVYVYPSAKIWDPKNLLMLDGATLDENVFIFNVAPVSIGKRAIISRNAKICTASHNYNLDTFNLITKPICINNDAWVCMDAFVGPGITIGSFAIALARSVVIKDIPNYEVHFGNPAKFKNMRKNIKRQY